MEKFPKYDLFYFYHNSQGVTYSRSQISHSPTVIEPLPEKRRHPVMGNDPQRVLERVYVHAAKVLTTDGWVLVVHVPGYPSSARPAFRTHPGGLHPQRITVVTNLPEACWPLIRQTRAAQHRFVHDRLAPPTSASRTSSRRTSLPSKTHRKPRPLTGAGFSVYLLHGRERPR